MKYPGKIPDPEAQLWFEKAAEKAGVEGTISGNCTANPCVRLYGPGPENTACKQCRLFLRKEGYSKTYFKCELRGNTNGPGTDHRANWPACARFVKYP